MNSKYDGYSFLLRDTVTREKVHFHNRYGIELCGDLYLPRALPVSWRRWRCPAPLAL